MAFSLSRNTLAAAAAATLGLVYMYRKSSQTQIPDCCPGQSEGFLPQDPSYKARGTMVDIGGGLNAYVVGSSNKRSVVMFHDIFGMHSGRHKQIADELAARGFLVVMPDFFQTQGGGLFGREAGRMYGNSFGTFMKFMGALISGKMKGFQREHPWKGCCEASWGKVASYLENRGCASIGLLSFCWGAYPAVHAAADGGAAVGAAVFFHPSFDRTAALFGENQEELVKSMAASTRVRVYSTGMESKAWKPGGQAEQWATEADGEVKWELVGQTHGFMTRGDMRGDLALAKDVQRMLEEAIEWLKQI